MPRVVVIGGGFGGLAVAKALRHAKVQLTIIDRTNHHLFQPLLYQVATAGLSPADIAVPIRRMMRGRTATEVVMAEVTGVDIGTQTVLLADGEVRYDYLVIATGAENSYFGHAEWASIAPGLKTIEDAIALRANILTAFENAERCASEPDREAWLTFAVIGGGPTGVELAGSLTELARRALTGEFNHIRPDLSRVILIEAGDRLLPSFPKKLSERCLNELRAMGVEVLLNSRVSELGATNIEIGDQSLSCRTVLWAAGVKPAAAGAWLSAKTDHGGRVLVDQYLNPEGHSNIYVIGDAAAVADDNGVILPPLAQPAMQAGAYVARRIWSQVSCKPTPDRFRYKNLGIMATIGRRRAVADMPGYQLSGFPAWLLWVFIHLWQLVGFKNKAVVFLQWIWAYVTWERGVRLITHRKRQ